jgi:hypothetical protein
MMFLYTDLKVGDLDLTSTAVYRENDEISKVFDGLIGSVINKSGGKFDFGIGFSTENKQNFVHVLALDPSDHNEVLGEATVDMIDVNEWLKRLADRKNHDRI